MISIKMRKRISLFLILIPLSLSAFAQIHKVSSKEIAKDVAQGKIILIDVREKDEIQAGMIKDAHWFALSKFKADPSWKEEFKKLTKGKEILLYCRSGARSGRVKEILEKEGISAKNIGGYMHLKDQLPTTK